MAKVTFEDKVTLNENVDIPNINKCMASDLNELKASINALYDEFMLKVYPVGSIYLAYNDTNPSTLFGGTWARIENRFLWAKGTGDIIGNVGGESTHKLTSAESGQKNLGSITTGTENQVHDHTITTGGYTYPNGSSPGAFSTATSGSTLTKDTNDPTYTGNENAHHNHTFSIGGQDASQAHNNMPPYIVVSIWRRTA